MRRSLGNTERSGALFDGDGDASVVEAYVVPLRFLEPDRKMRTARDRLTTTPSCSPRSSTPRSGPADALPVASFGLGSTAGLDEAGFVGEDDGLDAVAESELGEQVGDVGLDRGFRDVEVGGDLGVGFGGGDVAEDFELPVAELGELWWHVLSGGGRRTYCSISRRVTEEARSASPAATVRTPSARTWGGAVLSRKPLAPARMPS